MTQRNADRLVWVDCEMTGLELGRDALIEIAVIVTDSELVELDEGIDIVIAPPAAALETMPEVVRTMHTESGLLDELAAGVDLATAQRLVLEYVRRHVPEPRKAPLAGSSVYVDRGFISRDLPEFDAHLHYRLVDVSSVKELARRWYPKVFFASPKKTGNHRALADIQESISELRFYRDTVFAASPGPDTDTARAAAARHAKGTSE